ncbi:hypothetical protein AK812_SmicGene4022 [Symbiodinium microadriaticum]|uniref:Uncharacterized protein n=1 Tax=Symbiodinium microadriaticum TaxID=2951 RepID=A0A1Q9EXH4_SYMMI|nr:hypothetical protein AK812_SmicGene4022 [Symbiodinium microadriaticum]
MAFPSCGGERKRKHVRRSECRDDLEEIAFSAGIWEAGRFEEQLLTLMYEADASDPRAASLLTSRASWTTSWEGPSSSLRGISPAIWTGSCKPSSEVELHTFQDPPATRMVSVRASQTQHGELWADARHLRGPCRCLHVGRPAPSHSTCAAWSAATRSSPACASHSEERESEVTSV